MKKLNKNKQNAIKNIMMGAVLGTVLTGGIAVTAVGLTAKEIKYTPSNENFKVTNVEEAMNEIYKISEYKIPEDTYFYEQGTEGDSSTIARYKKINDEYYICDQSGKVDEGALAIDVTSKTLIPYTATSPSNLSAGAAGYASNSLVLGDTENNNVIKLGTYNASGTVLMGPGNMQSVKIDTNLIGYDNVKIVIDDWNCDHIQLMYFDGTNFWNYDKNTGTFTLSGSLFNNSAQNRLFSITISVYQIN